MSALPSFEKRLTTNQEMKKFRTRKEFEARKAREEEMLRDLYAAGTPHTNPATGS
jgi:hypothetical protein